jgi:HAD superfamily hydrolase (TIGR01509 family)
MTDKIKALIFDFDGLILDTETADYTSWKETFAAYGCELPLDLWSKFIGTHIFNPYEYLEELLGQPVDRYAVRALRKKRDNELIASIWIMPGVEGYLAEAQRMGLRIGLASSSDHAWVDTHLARLGLLDAFEVISCRDDVGNRGKPDPAVYQAALQAFDMAPHQALALEDSPNGIQAAKAAGLWCTAVPNKMTRDLNFSQADYQLDSLADMGLSQLITEVLNGKQ